MSRAEPLLLDDFIHSDARQPHAARAQAILAAHPEVRTLIGRNPWTAAILAFVFVLQVSIAAFMGRLGLGHWWLALIVAYAVGAFANHCLYVIIHEATHNLIFRHRVANQIAAVVADLTNVVPAAISFAACHLAHHAHQGEFARDADIASEWEARLIGRSALGKALWLLLFPVFTALRVVRVTTVGAFSEWSIVNMAAALVFDVGITVAFGANALIYLIASLFFSVGLHTVGGRWIQEHYTFEPGQETFSYYGPLNLVALNVGYHNEHHDFPSIPWNRLPKLRAMAPEFYDGLTARNSWTRLLAEFIFDERYSLHSRVVRTKA